MGADQFASDGIIDKGTAEYYGMWALESNNLLQERNQAINQIQLTLAIVTAVYSVYNFVTAIKSAQMAINTTQTIYSSSYLSAANEADDLLTSFTHNPSSNKVMLGTTAEGITWHQAGEQQGMTYFYSPNWDNYVAQYGKDAMRALNKDFLYRQRMAGKQFWFSHDPMLTLSDYSDSSFAMELNWLKESYGLTQLTKSNFTRSGSYWYFVP